MLPLKQYLAIAIVGGAISASSAQETSAPLDLLWKVQADDVPYLLSTSHAARGLYLNHTAGGSLLLASRDGGNLVRRLDPATGQLRNPATLPNSTYTGPATFIINKVVVSDDGIIYVTNLSVASTTTELHFTVYRHADEFSEATVAFVVRTDNFTNVEGTGINRRLGDDVDIIGSGNETKILVAGGSGGGVHLLTTTDGGLTFNRTQLTGTPAFPSVTPHISWDPIVPDRFYYRGAGGEGSQAYDISGSTATGATGPGTTLPGTTITDAAYGPFDIGLFNGVKSFALGIGASSAGTEGKVHKVYRLDEPEHQLDWYGNFAWYSGGAKGNGNAAGDVYIDSDNNEIYFLYTNNSITKYGLPGSSVGNWSIY